MNKKKLLIIIICVLLLIISVTVYLIIMSGNKKENKIDNKDNNVNNITDDNKDNIVEDNNNDNNDSINIANLFNFNQDEFGDIRFKIDKDIIGLYDEYEKADFSLRKVIDGSKVTAELEGITVKIENGKIVYEENGNKVYIENIENPISLRLEFDVTGDGSGEHYNPLYVLNENKELYKVEVNEKKVNLIEKVEEKVDAFDFTEGNSMLLTRSEGQNLILITKSGEDIKVNGTKLSEFNKNVYIYQSIFVGKDGNNFVKYNGKDLIVKAVILSTDTDSSNADYIYIVSEDDTVFVMNYDYDYDNDIDTFNIYKKDGKFKSLEIDEKAKTATIEYGNTKEKFNLAYYYLSYYDGKIYRH